MHLFFIAKDKANERPGQGQDDPILGWDHTDMNYILHTLLQHKFPKIYYYSG